MEATKEKLQGGQVGMWIAILAVISIPLVLLVYYLNKGIRDLFKGPVSAVVGYVGNAFKESSVLLDQEAYSWGYDSAKAQYDPQLQYDLQRSQYAKARGVSVSQAYNLGWPTFKQWKDGVKPTV